LKSLFILLIGTVAILYVAVADWLVPETPVGLEIVNVFPFIERTRVGELTLFRVFEAPEIVTTEFT
jgi:hypothetical protein